MSLTARSLDVLVSAWLSFELGVVETSRTRNQGREFAAHPIARRDRRGLRTRGRRPVAPTPRMPGAHAAQSRLSGSYTPAGASEDPPAAGRALPPRTHP